MALYTKYAILSSFGTIVEKNISGQGITSKDGVVTPYQTAYSADKKC